MWNVNLFKTARNSDTGALPVETMHCADRHPEVLSRIEADLNAHALEWF